MKVQRFLLAIAVLVSVGSLRADSSSVPWGDETAHPAASGGLSWKKPKTSSGVVTADRIPVADKAVRQVQFQGQMTPAQQDMVYPERRPQLNAPPSGAISESLLPTPTLPTATPPRNLQMPASLEPVPDAGTTPAPQPSRTGTLEIACPDTAAFKSIREISHDIRPMPGELPKECPLIAPGYTGRHYGRSCFFWKASALCTKGAYFEDVQLERYGHSLCPALQPIISGVRFFVTVPLLPYKMGLELPNECVYTLGHYRVGSCAPYMLDPLPISVRAVLFEAAAVGGVVAIIP